MSRPNRGYELSDEPNKFGFYQITWTDKGRSYRRSTRTRDRVEAKKIFAQFLIEIEDTKKKRKSPTVNLILDDYLEEHVRSGDLVSVGPQEHCVKCVRAHFGRMRLEQIRPEHVKSYRRKRAAGEIGDPAGDSTCRRDLTALIAAINHALNAERISPGDVPNIQLPPSGEPVRKWLTDKARDRYFEAIPKTRRVGRSVRVTKLYMFSLLAIETAARRAAIQQLRWSQVDLESGVIHFNPPGRRQTKKRRPIVPISDALFPVLSTEKARVQDDDAYVVGVDWDATGAVSRAAKAAGVPGVSPNVFRHTYASRALQEGVDPFHVAEVMGDTVATVLKHYGHHCKDKLRSAVNFRAAS